MCATAANERERPAYRKACSIVRKSQTALLVVSLGSVLACAGGTRPNGVFVAEPMASGADASTIPEVPYAASATENFERAEALVRAHALDEARALFVIVARRFSFSRQAPLAELRVADVDFARGAYDEAAREYAAWAHDHASDERVPGALRRASIAQCRAAKARACEDDDAGT